MTGIRFDRLAKLAKFLEGVPDEEFDIDNWEPYSTCSTCAVGHALRTKLFLEEGFVADGCGPVFDGTTQWSAVERFFGLSSVEAKALLGTRSMRLRRQGGGKLPPITPSLVREQIKAFIRANCPATKETSVNDHSF